MNKPLPASFRFLNYRVSEFHFYQQHEDDDRELDLNFNPSGSYFKKDGSYILEYDFIASYQENEETKEVVRANMISLFKFSEVIEFEDIPDYFYTNSLAITFPYLRAFVSTLTLMGNVSKMLVLPTLNLVNYKDELKSNTSLIDLTEDAV